MEALGSLDKAWGDNEFLHQRDNARRMTWNIEAINKDLVDPCLSCFVFVVWFGSTECIL